MPKTHCAYCNTDDIDVINPDPKDETCEIIPAADDTEAWAEMAKQHGPCCEWIETRAHQMTPAQEFREAQARIELKNNAMAELLCVSVGYVEMLRSETSGKTASQTLWRIIEQAEKLGRQKNTGLPGPVPLWRVEK